jgi:hypothetical protein
MFRKTITAGLAVAMLAVPTAAMADAPTPGTFTVNESAPAYQDLLNLGDANVLVDGEFKGSLMGEYNSRVKQQGWYISDQARALGGRGDAVQAVHVVEGIGSQK